MVLLASTTVWRLALRCEPMPVSTNRCAVTATVMLTRACGRVLTVTASAPWAASRPWDSAATWTTSPGIVTGIAVARSGSGVLLAWGCAVLVATISLVCGATGALGDGTGVLVGAGGTGAPGPGRGGCAPGGPGAAPRPAPPLAPPAPRPAPAAGNHPRSPLHS